MGRYLVATTCDLPIGALRRLEVAGRPVCLARTAEGVYAIADQCPHEGASLSEGDLIGREVECPLHSSRFDVRTGAVRGLPALEPAVCFAVAIDGDQVFIEL
jgi:nitrite reductase/ring-hydroxylating ferredoxin subunit